MLADVQIEALCLFQEMVVPFVPENLNVASLDICLGPDLLLEDSNTGWRSWSIADTTSDKPYQLDPGEFVLGASIEVFKLPNYISGMFCLKSSRGREGYDHSLAGFLDPGWSNSAITLELSNKSRFFAIPLYVGMPIGQVVFYQMDKQPSKSYRQTGHYNNDRKVQPSRFDPRMDPVKRHMLRRSNKMS